MHFIYILLDPQFNDFFIALLCAVYNFKEIEKRKQKNCFGKIVSGFFLSLIFAIPSECSLNVCEPNRKLTHLFVCVCVNLLLE